MAEELGLVMGPPSSTQESTPVVMEAKPENSNIAIAKTEPEKEKMSNINVQPVNVQHLNVQPVNVQAVKEEVAGSKVAAGEGLGSQQVQVGKKMIENWRKNNKDQLCWKGKGLLENLIQKMGMKLCRWCKQILERFFWLLAKLGRRERLRGWPMMMRWGIFLWF